MDAATLAKLLAVAVAIAAPAIVWALKVVGNLSALNTKADVFLERFGALAADHRDLAKRVDAHDVQLAELRTGRPQASFPAGRQAIRAGPPAGG